MVVGYRIGKTENWHVGMCVEGSLIKAKVYNWIDLESRLVGIIAP